MRLKRRGYISIFNWRLPVLVLVDSVACEQNYKFKVVASISESLKQPLPVRQGVPADTQLTSSG